MELSKRQFKKQQWQERKAESRMRLNRQKETGYVSHCTLRKRQSLSLSSYRECEWAAYGCVERIPIPEPRTGPNHEDSCQFQCHPTVHAAWIKFRKFQNKHLHFKPNVPELLVSQEREFKHAERWVDGMKSCPTTIRELRLYKVSDVWQNGEPPPELATPLGISGIKWPQILKIYQY